MRFKTYIKFCIGIVGTIFVSLMNISADYEASMINLVYPNCPGYRLLINMAAHQDSVEATYYVSRRDRFDKPPRTLRLDSIRAVYAEATDTNTFIFICADGQTNHLVVVKTSPTVQFDTLMTQSIHPPGNWLTKPYFVTILPSLDIVAGNFEHGHNSGLFEIRRMNGNGSTLLLHTIKNAKHMAVSLDRNELYFGIMPYWDDVPYYYIRVYDVVADSFYNLRNPDYSMTDPTRSTMDSPLYYVRGLRADSELWRMMPDGNHERMLSFNSSEILSHYNESLESLEVVIRNVTSDSTYKVIFEH